MDINGFEGAWAVDGALVDADIMRVVAYAGTGGAEGVVSAADCRVHQLPVPGTQIVVDPGALLIRNRSAQVRNQTYAATAPAESRLDVTETGSSGGRSDLVVLRMVDPQFAPWTDALNGLDPDTYQYAQPFIIQNVPPTTTRFDQLNLDVPYSAYALSRLDIPANTATITDSMVKNLRKVARPRRERHVEIWTPPSAAVDYNLHDEIMRLFPQMIMPVDCPDWATQLKIVVHLSNMLLTDNLTGGSRAEYGWNPDSEGYIATPSGGWHKVDQAPGGDWERGHLTMGGELKIPAGFRGKTHNVRVGTSLNSDGLTGKLTQDKWMTVVVDCEFLEVAE